MKKKLLSLAVCVLAFASAVAGPYQWVYLNNGSSVYGQVTDNKDQTYITVTTAAGEKIHILRTDINKISENAPALPDKPKKTARLNDYSIFDKGFWIAVQAFGGSTTNYTSSAHNSPVIEANVVGGYRFSEFLKAGVGTGARWYTKKQWGWSDSRRDHWAVPLFATVRGNIIAGGERNVVPYYSFDLGWAFKDGFMVRPGVGLRIGRERSAFLVSLNYTAQGLPKKTYDGNKTAAKCTVSMINVGIGYEF